MTYISYAPQKTSLVDVVPYDQLVVLPEDEFAERVSRSGIGLPEQVLDELRAVGGDRDRYLRQVTVQATDVTLSMMELGTPALYARLMAVALRECGLETTETLAVSMDRSGVQRLHLNHGFVSQIHRSALKFGLAHEALHLILRHLESDTLRPDRKKDQLWMLACEAVINHLVAKHLDIPVPEGAVDPEELHIQYVERTRDKGIVPVSYEEFVASDEAMYSHLRQVFTAEEAPDVGACSHRAASADGMQVDGDTLGDHVETTLSHAAERAHAGDEHMKRVLIDLMEATPSLSGRWGDLGLNALRGKSNRSQAHPIWQHLFVRALKSILADDGTRIAYCRKTGWWPTGDPRISRPLAPKGKEEQSNVLIAIDTSGSMPDEVVQAVAETVGQIPKVKATWVTFDAQVHEFKPGEPLVGGGGTSFGPVVDYALGLEQFPDAIVAVTDGYAEKIDPPYPDRWLWLITPRGDQWPAKRRPPMLTVEFDPTQL